MRNKNHEIKKKILRYYPFGVDPKISAITSNFMVG